MNMILLSILEDEKKLNRKLVRLANEGTMEFLHTNEEQMDLQKKIENKLNFMGIKYDVISTNRRNVLILKEEKKEESESVEA